MNRLNKLLQEHPEIERMTFNVAMPTTEKAVEVTGVSLEESVKTLIIKTNTQKFMAVIVRGCSTLDRTVLRKLIGCRKFRFATTAETLEHSGFPAGGVAPIGFEPGIEQVYIDSAIFNNEVVVGGGGTVDSLLKISPQLIQQLNNATLADIIQK